MESQIPENSNSKRIQKLLPSTPTCTNCSCFFCNMSETDPLVKRAKIARCLKQMPLRDDKEYVLALSSIWRIAMTKPNDPEFPCLGIFRCMAKLIQKGLRNKGWLLNYQNIYIPYYAAHIIGSYTMNKAKFAEKAVKSNVVGPLIELLRGKISWVEQRVSLRALGHLARHESTFEAVAEHEEEIIQVAIDIASTCLCEVYNKFVGLEESQRLEYHRNLLTRGLGGLELENRKAEEWAGQLQCWSLYLLDCFACKERSLRLICKKEFLKDLCKMWGGLANPKSPSGIGLLRTLCRTNIGRETIAEVEDVVENLCLVSRSSDDRKHLAIDSLLQLLKDPITRYKVIEAVAPVLADLVELKGVQAMERVLLQDYHKIKYFETKLKSEKAEKALREIWDLKVERAKRESLMSVEEIREREILAYVLKKEGNKKFRSGKVEEAVMKYSEAIDVCGVKARRERIVLYSNRAQCYLVLRDADAAIRDTTRALSLSSHVACRHSKSLWRRSQAYDMKGLAKESMMDCLAFIRSRFRSQKKTKTKTKKRFKIPYYAARMLNKQMNATWPFASAKSKRSMIKHVDELDEFRGHQYHQVGVKIMRKVTTRKKEGRRRKTDRTRTNVSRQRL